jgi:dihydrofolate reductase
MVDVLVTLIAIVGADAAIGPADGLPIFSDHEDQERHARWMLNLTKGGITVIGSNTLKIMNSVSRVTTTEDYQLAIWSRSHGLSPEKFLDTLKQEGRPIFIAGGQKTYETFTPYCHNFYIRRSALSSRSDYHLPPILSAWADRTRPGLFYRN